MRHRRRGRKLGRNPNHQRALLRNLAAALFLTERETYEGEANAPKTPGRIVTTLPKAKEVRPLVERCITIACRSLVAEDAAERLRSPSAPRSQEWRQWRASEAGREWAQAMAPAVKARRRVLQLIGDKAAVRALFDRVARRFENRSGGYTRILKLAKPRLGDSSPRAILELVGVRDRTRRKAQRPEIEPEVSPATSEPAAQA